MFLDSTPLAFAEAGGGGFSVARQNASVAAHSGEVVAHLKESLDVVGIAGEQARGFACGADALRRHL